MVSPRGTDEENLKAYQKCPFIYNKYFSPLNTKTVFPKLMVNIVFKNQILVLGNKILPLVQNIKGSATAKFLQSFPVTGNESSTEFKNMSEKNGPSYCLIHLPKILAGPRLHYMLSFKINT